MLLVARLEALSPPAGRHAGVGIGDADLLVFAALAGSALGRFRLDVPVLVGDRLDVTDGKALPADVGADQRGVHMHHLALGDPGLHAVLDRALEDAAEPVGAPALANARQRRMVRQPCVQPVAGEPADRQIDLGFAHQPPVVDDPEQESGEHQANGRLRIDPWPTYAGGVKIGDVVPEPREIEHPVHPRQNVIVRNKIAQRSANKKLQLIAVLLSDQACLHDKSLGQ